MTPEPIAWSDLLLAAWPLWLAMLVVLTVGLGDQFAAALAWFRRGSK